MVDLHAAIAHLEQGDWRAAHAIVQQDDDDRLSCWAHGVVHLMEGDTANARYWYKRAKRAFPAKPSIEAEIGALRAALER